MAGRFVQSSAVTSMFVAVVEFQSFSVASAFPFSVFNVYGRSVRTTWVAEHAAAASPANQADARPMTSAGPDAVCAFVPLEAANEPSSAVCCGGTDGVTQSWPRHESPAVTAQTRLCVC